MFTYGRLFQPLGGSSKFMWNNLVSALLVLLVLWLFFVIGKTKFKTDFSVVLVKHNIKVILSPHCLKHLFLLFVFCLSWFGLLTN